MLSLAVLIAVGSYLTLGIDLTTTYEMPSYMDFIFVSITSRKIIILYNPLLRYLKMNGLPAISIFVSLRTDVSMGLWLMFEDVDDAADILLSTPDTEYSLRFFLIRPAFTAVIIWSGFGSFVEPFSP